MSKLECMLSQLDLFSPQPVQSSILRTEKVSYNPITSLENSGSIEFHIPGNGDTYRDMSSIRMVLSIIIENHAPAPAPNAADQLRTVHAVNNLFHSLFRQCTVYLNNTLVSHDDANYHYKCFFETILNYGQDAANTHLKNIGWYLDTGNNLDSLDPDAHGNTALRRRAAVYGNRDGYRIVQFVGKLHIDVGNIQKLIPPGVDIRISLVKENPAFYLMTLAQNDPIDVRIIEANLSINHVHVNPNIILAHHQTLSNHNAVYPFKKTTVRQYTINNGSHSLSLDNIIIGQLPNILVFGMVANDAYTGSKERNPFFFRHYNLSSFGLYVNGNLVSGRPITFDYSNETGNVLTKGYETLFSGSGIHFSDRGHQITKELYERCYFLLMFDLTADQSYNTDCAHMFNEGTIRIEGIFKEAIPEPITCLVYCEFDASMEIDKNKNVYVS